MVEICAIASGSNGNCYYVGNAHEAVLIDAGISRRQVLKRMKEVKLDISKVKAVFVTHEHADHLRGLRVLCDMNNIDAYLSQTTYAQSRVDFHPQNVITFSPGDSITIGSITIHSFSKQHDAIDPCSFRVEIDGKHIGVLTDLGEACDTVKRHLDLCDAAFLESNYDQKMLEEGPYPYHLKQRVSSNKGHLSNAQALDLVQSLGNTSLKTIFLSHISADNNKVDLAMKAFLPVSNDITVKATSRHAVGEVFAVN